LRLWSFVVGPITKHWQFGRTPIAEANQSLLKQEALASVGEPKLKGVPPGSEVVKRVDLAYQAFFRRVKMAKI
jgi:hypothetical protein